MSQWFDNALARAESVDDWLAPARQHSLQLLKTTPWPNRKTEAWKYTSLKPLADSELSVSPPVSKVPLETLETLAIDGLECIDILFVDGRPAGDLPGDLPEGVTLTALSDNSQGWVREKFARVKPERHLFGLVNDVLAIDGVVIDIADGVKLDRPLRIASLMNAGCEAHLRLIVRLGKGAAATVLEQFAGSDSSFITGVAEFEIGEGAALEHYRFALQTGAALSVGGDHFRLGTNAQLNSNLVGFGSQLSRLDVDVYHAGEHARAELNAIYLLDGNERFDLHSAIEHAVPHCNTEEKVRGIVGGSSRAVFNGRIHIHRHAQKTVAELNNLNLLMSRDAEVDTKPELEIYADDVRCAHGATIAEIDKKSLYYLQSRGISRTQAQVMLSFGFINELVNDMPNEALAEWLRPLLRERFEQMQVV